MSLLSTKLPTVKKLSLGGKLQEVEPTVIVETKVVEAPHPEPEIKAPKPGDKPKLVALAKKIIEGQNNYRREVILNLIQEETKVTNERAEIGFKLMLDVGAIEQSNIPELYYLGGSTPF